MTCMGILSPKCTLGLTDTSWRRMRKASHEALNKLAVHGLNDYQVLEALALARGGMLDASSWDGHIRRTAASLMLSSLYGVPQVRHATLSRRALR